MESSVSSGMCRCCASEGTFKDINAKYYWMGEEEIYSEMLNDCFNISLNESSQNGDSGICEVCITQLRNSVNFKKQVLNTEDQFKNHLESKMFKECEIKVEYTQEDSTMESESNGSDEDYSAIEFVVPLKKEEEDSKPKKRSSSSKPSTSRGKKPKKERVNKSTSKSIATKPPKVDTVMQVRVTSELGKFKKSIIIDNLVKSKEPVVDTIKESIQSLDTRSKRRHSEMRKHLQNLQMILTSTNATPIKSYGGTGYSCAFCKEEFLDPRDLKIHTVEGHDDSIKKSYKVGTMLKNYSVKLDITSLKCNLCFVNLDSLDGLLHHLQIDHQKEIYTDIKNHILPFKFDTEELTCAICSQPFEHFKYLVEHIIKKHLKNYICNSCGEAFVNKRYFLSHSNRHNLGIYSCIHCGKVYNTMEKKKYHERNVHGEGKKRVKCPVCAQGFTHYTYKREHMVREHGTRPRNLKCNACDRVFNNKVALTIHTKRDHLMERNHECKYCDMSFFAKWDLRNHMLKHTGVKDYKCDICDKTFGRKTTLREHLRIHDDDKRFKCQLCGQEFVQKVSWKSHLRSRHGVIYE